MKHPTLNVAYQNRQSGIRTVFLNFIVNGTYADTAAIRIAGKCKKPPKMGFPPGFLRATVNGPQRYFSSGILHMRHSADMERSVPKGQMHRVILIKQIHTVTSNILFEQRRFCLGSLARFTVSGGALRTQRKIWAAADFQNFLTRPNTRRPRKKGG